MREQKVREWRGDSPDRRKAVNQGSTKVCGMFSKQFAAPEASSYLLFPVRVYEKTLEREARSRL